MNNVIHYNETKVAIPAGNYNATSLADAIMAAFNNELQVTYSRTQQKYVFEKLQGDTITLHALPPTLLKLTDGAGAP